MASVFGGFGSCVHSLLKRHPRHHHEGEAEGRKSKERNESSCLYLQTGFSWVSVKLLPQELGQLIRKGGPLTKTSL